MLAPIPLCLAQTASCRRALTLTQASMPAVLTLLEVMLHVPPIEQVLVRGRAHDPYHSMYRKRSYTAPSDHPQTPAAATLHPCCRECMHASTCPAQHFLLYSAPILIHMTVTEVTTHNAAHGLYPSCSCLLSVCCVPQHMNQLRSYTAQICSTQDP
jgi:hypothetical protein